ncbi:hypothetical protein BKA58DRAFT_470852 [Alternaria rosae]|uniref:uncharacterized protein n=1 Tax=Alternaria rosae TaxID=1187941 RepID=UPI001E8CBA1D|nr:uncharacterized protein BKA58DRAFT_470852 [Alternaria rosae]KAH6866564.1 hypothetical protein BKA58DRAFT_470852 [Alternaria rosae]
MDNEMRPARQSPTFAPKSPGTDQDSWKTAPGSPREDFRFNIDAITEECGTFSSDIKRSSRQPHALRREYNEKFDYAEHNPDIDGIDWRPRFKNQFPWIGFAGLMVIFVATATAAVILVSSHKKRVKGWPFTSFPAQPNVLLNIANQIQNLGLITLVSHGLAIAWWRTALRGSSLRVLHKNHVYSYSFYAIVTSGRYFNLIALAALMTKFAVVDSTLVQKATRTIVTQQKEYANSTMTGWIERDWPANFGGIPGADGRIKTVDTTWPASWMHITASSRIASGAIEGLGFAFNCTTGYEKVDYGLRQWEGSECFGTSYSLWDVKFGPSWTNETKPYASTDLKMQYVDSQAGKDDRSCPGTMNIRTCEIRPAIVRYPVTVMLPRKEELDGRNIVTHIKFFNDDRSWRVVTNLNNITQIDDLKVLNTANLNEYFNETSIVGALAYIKGAPKTDRDKCKALGKASQNIHPSPAS